MESGAVREISVAEVARRRSAGEHLLLLDVREPAELNLANLGGGVFSTPMSAVARSGLDALPAAAQDPTMEIVVFCHHGIRSANVGAWLQQQGWTNVWNMAGGIDAYARFVDPSIGFY